MPLPDAIDLLAKDFADYINASMSSSSNGNGLQQQHHHRGDDSSARSSPRHGHDRDFVEEKASGVGADDSTRYPVTVTTAPSPSAAPDTEEDPGFLPPSRHIAALLRMLADSRVLSVGELDELAAFIAERRARLTNELFSSGIVYLLAASYASSLFTTLIDPPLSPPRFLISPPSPRISTVARSITLDTRSPQLPNRALLPSIMDEMVLLWVVA